MGLANEAKAQSAYVKYCQSSGHIVSILSNGLLYPNHSYLSDRGD